MDYKGTTRSSTKGLVFFFFTVFLFGIGMSQVAQAEGELSVRVAPTGFADYGYSEGPLQYIGSEALGIRQAIEDFQSLTYTEYLLSEGDVIFVDVLNHEELTGEFTIGPDGKKTLPIAGVVHLAGLTRDEAAQRISQALAPHYQAQISVTVRVNQYNGNRFYVYGGVRTPGVYQFGYSPTLLDLISEAGGVPVAQPKPDSTQAPKPFTIYCTVIRGEERLSKVDISRLVFNNDLSLNFLLRQNDVVHIHQLETTPLYVMGEVARPGYYNVTPNMTLLDALTQAGSITEDAAKKRIHVIHMQGYTHEIINFFDLAEPDAALDVALYPGDLVYVPRNYLATVNYWLRQIFGFLSPISSIGLGAAAL